MNLNKRFYLSVIISVFLLSCAPFAPAQDNAPKLRPIQKAGKWGYIDKTGRVVIEPKFFWVEEFSEGLAAFETDDGKHGYLDETGKIVIEPVFDRAEPFSEGLAPVARDFEWGFIDKSGKIVIPLQYQYAHAFRDGMAPVILFLKKEEADEAVYNKVAFIDPAGRTLIGPVKNVLNPRVSLGFALLPYTSPFADAPDPEIIDKNGRILIQAQKINLDGFREGVTPVMKNDKWGYIDTTGKFVIEPQFAEAKSFSEGLALVKTGQKWGFIDHQGKLAIPAKFQINEIEDANHSFSEGLALVYLNDRFTFIDRTGKAVFGFDYDRVEPFTGGLALVKIGAGKNEKRGYLDKTGKFVWGPTEFSYKDTRAIAEKSREAEEKKENESLSALSDEEKRLDYRNLIADQPDFSADLTYFRSEEVSGSGGVERIARKGNRYRRESGFWTFIGETGESRVRLFPPTKTYDDFEPADDETVSYSAPFNPKTLASDAETTFTPLGKITIDGHECIKLEVRRKGENLENEKIFLYLAKNLKYLVIFAHIQNPPFSFTQRLENISLGVAETLVRIPPDYKPVERDVWRKLENVRVRYRGKILKNFGIFRSPTGELFVSVDLGSIENPYIWNYLVRPKEKTAVIAFQGMLVTRGGEYVWRSTAAEAFSETYYRSAAAVEDSKSNGKPVEVKPGVIKFSSHYSNSDWIEIFFDNDGSKPRP